MPGHAIPSNAFQGSDRTEDDGNASETHRPQPTTKGAEVKKTMRAIVSVLIAGMATVSLAGPAPAASGTQRFTVLLGEEVEPVIASGPVRGVGTLVTDSHQFNPEDGSVLVVTRFVFEEGTLFVTFRGQAQLESVARCVTRTAIDGTFEITGGTGRYEGATGGGTFTDRGTLVLRRGAEGCSEDGVFRAVIRATGAITFPDAAGRAA